MSRTAIIGDVHGCIEEMTELISRVLMVSDARFVFLGDFMDRGPDPVDVVQVVRTLGFEAVLGNHDEKHLRFRKYENERKKTGKKNPIRFDERRQKDNEALSNADIEWLSSLPLSLDLGNNWYAIHGGLEPNKTFEAQRNSPALLRTRFINDDGSAYVGKDRDEPDPPDKRFWAEGWRGPENIVYGHHIHNLEYAEVSQQGAGICAGIDTGCYAGGHLTVMLLEEDGSYAFDRVAAKRVYEPLSDKYRARSPRT